MQEFTYLIFGKQNVYIYNGKKITNEEQVKKLKNSGELIKIKPYDKVKRYECFIRSAMIPKMSGKMRHICVYDKYLLDIYKALSLLLEDVLNVEGTPLVGCVKNSNIQSITQKIMDATTHNTCIGSLDIVNYFYNIKKEKVYFALKSSNKFKETYLNSDGKKIDFLNMLSEFLCYKGYLPQGNPCSSIIANYVSYITWIPQVTNYCMNNNLFFSVYVDNIYIYSKEHDPSKINTHLDSLSSILESVGFNTHKKSITSSKKQQKVLGAIINKGPNAKQPRTPKRTRKRLMLFYGMQKNIPKKKIK